MLVDYGTERLYDGLDTGGELAEKKVKGKSRSVVWNGKKYESLAAIAKEAHFNTKQTQKFISVASRYNNIDKALASVYLDKQDENDDVTDLDRDRALDSCYDYIKRHSMSATDKEELIRLTEYYGNFSKALHELNNSSDRRAIKEIYTAAQYNSASTEYIMDQADKELESDRIEALNELKNSKIKSEKRLKFRRRLNNNMDKQLNGMRYDGKLTSLAKEFIKGHIDTGPNHNPKEFGVIDIVCNYMKESELMILAEILNRNDYLRCSISFVEALGKCIKVKNHFKVELNYEYPVKDLGCIALYLMWLKCNNVAFFNKK